MTPMKVPRPRFAVRLAWTLAGGLCALVAIPYGVYSMVDLFASKHDRFHAAFAGAIQAIEVETEGGSIEFIGVEEGPVVVDIDARRGLFDANQSANVKGNTLVVRGECPALFSGICQTTVTIRVPGGVTLKANSDGGSIRGTNLLSPVVEADADGGSVRLSFAGPVERIRAKANGGSVRLMFGDAATDVEAAADGGSVRFTFATPPGRVKGDANGGSVTVVLPSTSHAYRVEASADGGSVNTDVRTDPQSDRSIEIHADGGSASVRYPEP